jgi:tetratricopeptide (TPR) repeat protein
MIDRAGSRCAFQNSKHVYPMLAGNYVAILFLGLFVLLTQLSAWGASNSREVEKHLLRGQALLDQNHSEEAAKEFAQALVLNSRLAEARYQLGLAQWNLGRWAEARQNFRRTLSQSPDHVSAIYYLGRISVQNQDQVGAIEHFKHLIRVNKGKPVADEYFQLAKLLLTSGKPSEAIPVLEAGTKAQPRDDRLYAQLGKAYQSLGRKSEANEALKVSNDLRDYQREATRLLLEASEYLKAGENDKVRDIYHRILESSDVDDLVSLGISFGQHQQYSEAIELLLKATTLSPDSFEAHYNLGFMYLQINDQEKGRAHLTAATVLHPYSLEANSLLGVICSQLGRTDEAVRALQRAQMLSPENLKIVTLLSLQLIEARYYSEALGVLEQAVTRWPDDLDLRLLQVQSCHRDQKYEKAVQFARQTVSRFPESPRANFEMGYQLLSFGQFQQSKPFLEKSVRLDPELAEGYSSMGDALSREGKNEEAVTWFETALRKNPSHIESYLGLAKSLLALKRFPEAIAASEKVVQLDAANPQPHYHLSQALLALGETEKAQQESKLFTQLNQQRMQRRDHEGGRELPSP